MSSPAQESNIPLVDSTGATQKVRNVSIVIQQADGTLATVQMQAIAIVDPSTGNPATFTQDRTEELDLLRAILRALENLND